VALQIKRLDGVVKFSDAENLAIGSIETSDA